jgi:hypothetical protein
LSREQLDYYVLALFASSLPPSLPPYPLAGLVNVRDFDIRQGRTELGRVQLVVAALGGQNFVLLFDLGGREGGREGGRKEGEVSGLMEGMQERAIRNKSNP